MDEKRRSKRKSMDDGFWDCSVCTYRNTPEAFKCDMCDVRKGTSTRKPRFNPQLAATQQVAQQFAPPPKKERTPRRDREGKEVRDRDLEPDNDDSNFGEESIDTDQTSVNSHETETEVPVNQQETPPEPKSAEKLEKEKPKPEPTTSSQTKEKKSSTPSTSQPRKHRTPRLKNIDRSSGTSMEVTVGGVTVVITDYKPKKEKNTASNSATAPNAETVQQKDTPPESANRNGEPGSNNLQGTDASRSDAVASQQTNGHGQMESKKR